MRETNPKNFACGVCERTGTFTSASKKYLSQNYKPLGVMNVGWKVHSMSQAYISSVGLNTDFLCFTMRIL